MAMLIVRCPKTVQAIFTGLHIESSSFSSTSVFFSSTYCPHCRVKHEWFVKDAWVCDSDWSECEFGSKRRRCWKRRPYILRYRLTITGKNGNWPGPDDRLPVCSV
jgi:hypothetical protein